MNWAVGLFSQLGHGVGWISFIGLSGMEGGVFGACFASRLDKSMFGLLLIEVDVNYNLGYPWAGGDWVVYQGYAFVGSLR